MAIRTAVFLLSVAACVLANQSPINIVSSSATKALLPPLSFKHYHSSKSTYFLSNTGHGCQITLQNSMYLPRVSGGPLPNIFYLEQTHFHWGKTDASGSEHEIDGKSFSMEAHLVHWNGKYKNFTEASTKSDGLAVVGFFLEGANGYENSAFQNVVDIVPFITAEDSDKVKVHADLLSWVVPHLKRNKYFSYDGSLTTTPFSENVKWIVYKDPIFIGKSQIEPFRDIEDHHYEALKTNYRSLQNNSNVKVTLVA